VKQVTSGRKVLTDQSMDPKNNRKKELKFRAVADWLCSSSTNRDWYAVDLCHWFTRPFPIPSTGRVWEPK